MRYFSCTLLIASMAMGAIILETADAQTGHAVVFKQMLDEQVDAWNRGDGAGWAAHFTEDADFVNIRGDVFHGRGEIAARHTQILNGPFRGSHIVIAVRQVSEPAKGLALLETDQVVTLFHALPPGVVATTEGVLKTHMKYVALEQGGAWRFIAAQNTAVLPTPPGPLK